MKGVSPIITALLLIIVMVGATIIFYTWEIGFQSQLEESSEGKGSVLIKIEGVKVSNNSLHVFVRNIGERRAKIDRIYIVKPITNEVVSILVPLNAPVTVDPRSTVELVTYSPVNIEGEYLVKLGTVEGVEVVSPLSYKISLKAAVISVIINEVEGNPPGDDAGREWIELFNPTSQPIDVSGYEIWDKYPGDRLCTIGVDCVSESTIVPPQGYLVITGWDNPFKLISNSHPDGVILKDSSGRVVDETPDFVDSWNTAETFQRIPDGVGDWTFALATKGLSNSVVKIYINEYEANPARSDNNREWVEIYNPYDFAIDLSNMYIVDKDGNYRIIPFGSVVPAHGYFVFYIPGSLFNNNGDKAILRSPNPDGIVYDETPLLIDTSNNQYTWQRLPDGSDNWVFRTETPNSSNG